MRLNKYFISIVALIIGLSMYLLLRLLVFNEEVNTSFIATTVYFIFIQLVIIVVMMKKSLFP